MTREGYATIYASRASRAVMHYHMTGGKMLGPGVRHGDQQRAEDRAWEVAYNTALARWDAADHDEHLRLERLAVTETRADEAGRRALRELCARSPMASRAERDAVYEQAFAAVMEP